MSGPPPRTRQDRKHKGYTDTSTQSRDKDKNPWPRRESNLGRWLEGKDYTNHITAMNRAMLLTKNTTYYTNIIIIIMCSAQGQIFHCNSGTKAAVLPKGRSSTANSETKIAALQVMNRCGSFPLLSAFHSLLSISSDLKRSEKIQGAPAWRRKEWIWLTGPSGLHRNSPKGLWHHLR